MFGWLFTCLRLLRRLLYWTFLITLPFHLVPFLCGLFEGVFLSNLFTETYFASVDTFVSNIETAQWLDWFSVPGGPGIHDLAVQPFHVVQLRDPQNWWQKLGLRRFDIDVTDDVAMDGYPINLFASLEALYRRTPRHGQAQPWHHFVYASPSIVQMEGVWFNEWDSAFNELLKYHYANPAPTGAGFHFLSCPENFLCYLWATRGPALLHFTTELPDLSDEFDKLKERQQIPGYLPVVVRIIEFPLTDPAKAKLALPPGQFPSHFNQLRSVTSQPQVWQLYQPFSEFDQYMERLIDRCKEAEKTYAKTYGRLSKLEDWIDKKLGFEDSPWPGVARPFTIALVFGTKQILERVWELVQAQSTELRKRYWDKNKDEEPLEQQDKTEKEKQDDGNYQPDNFMAQMLKTFMDLQPVDFDAEAKKNPEVQEALDRMWETVQQKPVPVGDDEEVQERQARPLRPLKVPVKEPAWGFFEQSPERIKEMMKQYANEREKKMKQNAENMEEIMKRDTEDWEEKLKQNAQEMEEIWESLRKNKASDGEKTN